MVVPARRLSAILDEHREMSVDFLKIDTEGAEAAVLGGLDFDRHRPRVVVVEGVAPVVASQVGAVAISILERHGYEHAGYDGLNHYFTSDPSLAPALHAPANPTDNFVRHDRAVMERRLTELVAENARLAQENFDLTYSVNHFAEREPEIRALEKWAQDLARQLEELQARDSGIGANR